MPATRAPGAAAARLPRIAVAVIGAQAAAEAVEASFDATWFEGLATHVLPAARAEATPIVDGLPLVAEAALLLTDDDTLCRLNRDYRGIDRPTDVLAFPQLDAPPAPPDVPGTTAARPATAAMPAGESPPLHLGDIAISVERARGQAATYGHGFERELAYLFVHGLLHLLGYDHETPAERAVMRRVEEAALTPAGLVREAQ